MTPFKPNSTSTHRTLARLAGLLLLELLLGLPKGSIFYRLKIDPMIRSKRDIYELDLNPKVKREDFQGKFITLPVSRLNFLASSPESPGVEPAKFYPALHYSLNPTRNKKCQS
jgi:hypothetical protein